MRKSITIVAVVAGLAAAGCGKKRQAASQGGLGSAAAGSAAPGVAATEPAPIPLDPAHAAIAAAKAEVAAVVVPVGAPTSRQARTERAGKVIDGLVEMTRDLSRDAWNPKAVFEAVGRDRVALFKWVRDRTALVPYRGALRGPVGVVMDRLGNSLDRALLLADLLQQAGVEVRLVNGALDATAVAKLTQGWAARPRPALPAVTVDDAALVGRLVQDLGIDAAAFQDKRAKLAVAANALVDRTRTRIAEQAAAIAKLVPAAGPPPDADTAAFEDHWWVQAEDGGAWVDLDPSLPDAEPGQTLTAAGEAIAPDAVGDDRRHVLTVRVIGEVWRDRTREEAVLVEHSFAPADHWGQRIAITNAAFDMPELATLLASPAPMDALRAALINQTEWIPILRMGDGMVAKLSVSDAGELYDATDAHGNTDRLARVVQRATKTAVGGATDLLGTLPDDTGAPVPGKPPVAEHSGFTAEWIEYEIKAPGAAPTTVRRVVFDALGVADRSSAKPTKLSDASRLDRQLALGGETEILPMFARLPEAFVIDRRVAALAAARPVLAEMSIPGDKPDELTARLVGLAPVPGVLYDLALARFGWSGAADQVFLDRLDVLVQRRRLAGPDFASRLEIDIVANAVAVWPTAADARRSRITQGVADTAAESAVLGCATTGGCARGPNTSDQFAASSGAWTVTRPGSPTTLEHLPLAIRPLARADLASGYIVVAPPGAMSGTWWRVHGDSGETLGMGTRGGTASAEYATLNTNMFLYGVSMMNCAIRGAINGELGSLAWCGLMATLGLAGANYIATTEAIAAAAGTSAAQGVGLAIQTILILLG